MDCNKNFYIKWISDDILNLNLRVRAEDSVVAAIITSIDHQVDTAVDHTNFGHD